MSGGSRRQKNGCQRGQGVQKTWQTTQMKRTSLPSVDLRAALEGLGLTCVVLSRDPERPERAFEADLDALLHSLLRDAYGCESGPETFERVLYALAFLDAAGTPWACLTIDFFAERPIFFTTRCECVHPSLQRRGVGRLLFRCAEAWLRFAVCNEPDLARHWIESGHTFEIAAFIDGGMDWDLEDDNERGHGAFLRKLGFACTEAPYGQTYEEIAFVKAFPADGPVAFVPMG